MHRSSMTNWMTVLASAIALSLAAYQPIQPVSPTQASAGVTTYEQLSENGKAVAIYAPQPTKKLTLNRETIRLIGEGARVYSPRRSVGCL